MLYVWRDSERSKPLLVNYHPPRLGQGNVIIMAHTNGSTSAVLSGTNLAAGGASPSHPLVIMNGFDPKEIYSSRLGSSGNATALETLQSAKVRGSSPFTNKTTIFEPSIPVQVEFASHNLIKIQIPEGEGQSPKPLRLIVGDQESCSADLHSCNVKVRYHGPKIFSISTPNTPPSMRLTSGGYPLHIMGENFGRSSTPVFVVIGERECTVTFQDHHKIVCTVPEGSGSRAALSIVSAGRVAHWGPGFRFSPPRITTISPNDQIPTTGMQNVIIHGHSLGRFGISALDINVGLNSPKILRSTLGDDGFELVSNNHTTIVLNLPRGEGVALDVTIHVDDQRNDPESENAFISFAAPTLRLLEWGAEGSNGIAPTSGCSEWEPFALDAAASADAEAMRSCSEYTIFHLTGEHLWGRYRPRVYVQDYAGTVLEASIIDRQTRLPSQLAVDTVDGESTEISCLLPKGHGESKIWLVNIANQSSLHHGNHPLYFNYSHPQIFGFLFGSHLDVAVTVSHIDAVGSRKFDDGSSPARFFILGENFGESPSVLNITISAMDNTWLPLSTTVCTNGKWHEPTRASFGRPYLSCRPSPTTVGRKVLLLRIAGLQNPLFVQGPQNGAPLVARCGRHYYGEPGELCVECWHFYGEAGEKHYAANCSGVPTSQNFDGATALPVAKDGFAIDPPPECQSGLCNPGPEDGKANIPSECLPKYNPKDDTWSDPGLLSGCTEALVPGANRCHPHRVNATVVPPIANNGISRIVGVDGTPEPNIGAARTQLSGRRTICTRLLPCEPLSSCNSHGGCGQGYVSYYEPYLPGDACDDGHYKLPDGRCFAPRCSLCDPRSHFRLDGRCELCPELPWLLPLILGLICIAAAISMFLLSRNNVNLAVLSIGIDYFQVLSMFSRARVTWPPEIKWLFTQMQWFNFDIDLTGPECAFRRVMTFEFKWYLKVLMPVIAAMLIFLMWMTRVCKYMSSGLCHKKRRRTRRPNWAPIVSMFITMVYFFYLVITRAAFDIFNCVSTLPDTGIMYLAAAPIEECWKPGGLQVKMVPSSIAVLLFYCFAFPSIIFYIFRKYRKTILDDQLLRAYGRGDTRETNKNFRFRRAFSRLYYMYKPNFFWWIQILLARKFLIVYIGTIWKYNPTFQLSVMLLVMFTAFVLQVRYDPFMSTIERAEIVKEGVQREIHAEIKKMKQAELISRLSQTDSSAIPKGLSASEMKKEKKRIQEKEEKRIKELSKKLLKHQHHITQLEDQRDAQVKIIKDNHSLVFNYNFNEQVFLAISVLVNLSGVMFSSQMLNQPSSRGLKTFVTYATGALVISSIIYLIIIVIHELRSVKTKKKERARLTWAKLKSQRVSLLSKESSPKLRWNLRFRAAKC